MSYDIPILFVFFNRPSIVRRSFEIIKQIKPNKLYLSCDGPRENTQDYKKVIESKKIIDEMIDWDCEVKTRYLEKNVGCSLGVSTAIDWLFENEDYGIILEDDCIPNNSFFGYCEELLLRYKNDDRIGMIAGYNQIDNFNCDTSYIFSKFKACWGWATWKRAWINMDLSMEWLTNHNYYSILANMGGGNKARSYWEYRIKLIKLGYVSAWDWQWYFSLASQNQLCVFPKYNLISNVGFGKDSTHTTGRLKTDYIANRDINFPLVHPTYILPDEKFDICFHKKNNSLYVRISKLIPLGIKKTLKNILRKVEK